MQSCRSDLSAMPNKNGHNRHDIIGSKISALSMEQCKAMIFDLASCRESSSVCICNVHSVVTARQNQDLRRAINSAAIATPDGMPLAWVLRRCGVAGQERISGPDLMPALLQEAGPRGVGVFFYGSSQETLDRLVTSVEGGYTGIRVVGSYSPPFRPLTAYETDEVVKRINDSGAGLVFVGLGCPKQEVWMHEVSPRIQGVLIGVGAAFDFLAGTKKRAPGWMQRTGLEWAFRLCQEPRRLFVRYFSTNTKFVFHMAMDWIFRRSTNRVDKSVPK